MVYSYESFLTTLLDETVLRKYDLWVADVGATPSISYGIHQYSFKGQVEGIKGDCDLDVSLKNYPEIIENLKSSSQ